MRLVGGWSVFTRLEWRHYGYGRPSLAKVKNTYREQLAEGWQADKLVRQIRKEMGTKAFARMAAHAEMMAQLKGDRAGMAVISRTVPRKLTKPERRAILVRVRMGTLLQLVGKPLREKFRAEAKANAPKFRPKVIRRSGAVQNDGGESKNMRQRSGSIRKELGEDH